MEEIKELIENRLLELMSFVKRGKVKDAMTYSLLAPGKRIRPLLFLTILKSYKVDYKKYIDIACAIEMIHTYSLIHDDLPGMDNDDMRRGRLTCHKKFDEATAILAGDGLLNLSANTILNCLISADLKVKLLDELYKASGVNGMIYGQQQDLFFENKNASLDELNDVHHHKTGCLIAASMTLASIIANPKDFDIWKKIGFDLGLAFQIQDDILDVTSTTEILGKNIGSDCENNKSTYVTLLGIEKSQERVNELFEECFSNIYSLAINHGLILEIMNKILKRMS